MAHPREDVDTGNRAAPVAFGEAVAAWARVAALSFGGPAGQIAVMHRIVVDEKRWVSEPRFLHALNFCMLLPGPEAHQLTIYLGWLLHGVRGGIVAGLLFVLPGFVAMMALSALYAAFGQTGLVEALFFGLKAAVLAIVVQAVVRLGGRALGTRGLRLVAAAAFVAIFLFAVPFPLIVLGAGLIGWLAARAGLPGFRSEADGPEAPARPPPRAMDWRAPAAFAAIWLAPVAALVVLLGPSDTFAQLAIFFSQMAVVTFGGAYAVLAYVAQEAVQSHAWLAPGEMLDGLGMAETTPGPLIMVVQFVGFLAAFRNPGALDPWLAAVLGATLVTWVTFAPSFLWIFLGAPQVERAHERVGLRGALSAITAAVVGVILNLALWFALHVIFGEVRPWSGFGMRLDLPVLGSLDPAALALSGLAALAVFRFKAGMLAVLAGSAVMGLAWRAATGAI